MSSIVVATEKQQLLGAMLRTLRHSLHSCPEPAGREAMTSTLIGGFLGAYHPDELVTELGGYGVAAIYNGQHAGPTVLVRAELDALAVVETREEAETAGPCVADHRCGHDGHMAIVAGLAPTLNQLRPTAGRVVLLFQPSEETGEGALRILDDPRFGPIQPDYAVALHNLPGYPRHTVVLRSGTFSSASVGMQVELHGLASHAAEPEKARSPSGVLSGLLGELPELSDTTGDPYRLATVTHARLGRASFGITPGNATLCATLRAGTTETLDTLCEEAEAKVRRVAAADGLSADIQWLERFPATVNDPGLVDILRDECADAGREVLEAKRPFRWSEDFGYFCRVCPILYFGLGIGEDAARLHQPDYVFPDEAIYEGSQVLEGIVRRLTSQAPV